MCRIFSRQISRALGTKDIRNRRVASTEFLLRRLLALDYKLEGPGLLWLPSTGFAWPPSTTRSAVASIRRYAPAATVMRALLRSVADRLLNVACAMLRDGTCFAPHRVRVVAPESVFRARSATPVVDGAASASLSPRLPSRRGSLWRE